MQNAEHLIERILAAPDNARVGVLANELLREFQRGYPVDRLRDLLRSRDAEVVAVAAWIFSELAQTARSLIPELGPLFKHSEKRVRFHALDSLYWASVDNGRELAAGVRLLGDPDSGVRWKAMNLVASLSAEQLKSACNHLGHSEAGKHILPGLMWLLTREAEDPDVIRARIRSGDADLRRFASIAAARYTTKSPIGYELLREALAGEQDDISQFAGGKIRLAPKAS